MCVCVCVCVCVCRIIICDDKLKKLLGVEEFKGFGMAKLLAPHFLKKGENGPAADE